MDFLFAKVTNSRLMGGMGLIVGWKDDNYKFNQYFLLDAEGLGIADYVSIKSDEDDLLYREEERLMGGLGADRLYISKEEALYLVNYFGNKTLEYEKELPGNVDEYNHILKKRIENINYENIFKKICKEIESEVEFINYMTMRFIARDREGLKFFSINKEISDMHITEINGVLLKNVVKKIDNNRYRSECIFEDIDGYYKVNLGFRICKIKNDYKIRSLVIGNKKSLNPIDVLEEIKKEEYIGVYRVENMNEFIDIFHKQNPYYMKSEFENGILFTHFNKNNNHVKSNEYLISNDIYSIYYVNKNNQLVAANYNQENRMKIDEYLNERYKKYLDIENEYVFPGSLIYDFAESEYENFYDFIEG